MIFVSQTKRKKEMEGTTLKAAAKPTTAVSKQQEQKPLSYAQKCQALLASKDRMEQLQKALPNNYPVDRFKRIVMTAISTNPKLAQACCLSPNTFFGALYNAAQLGLEPNTPMGKAYLLPYNNIDKTTGKKVPMVQFQIGVYGLVDLAFRSGLVQEIDADVRRKNDFWQYEKGDDGKMRHRYYDDGDRGEAVGYYAIIKMKDGAIHKSYMSKYDVMEHAKRFSKSYNRKTGTFSGPWATDFDAMAKKTILIQALKLVPKATEDANIINAFSADNTVRDGMAMDAPTIKTEGVFVEGSASDAPYNENGDSDADGDEQTYDGEAEQGE